MDNINVIHQSATKAPLYSLFDNNLFWDKHVNVMLKHKWDKRYKKYSEWSLYFDGDGKTLQSIFHINNTSLFEEKYELATNGRGQEKFKIMTLHSSSLMPLLFFYSISKDNPIYVPLNGRMVALTRYSPEEPNEVEPNTNNHSNVDVALFNDEEKIVVLFESKFSEYLSPKSISVSLTSYYKNVYRQLNDTFDAIGIEVKDWSSYHTVIQTIKGRTPRYCEGPKQMISHFLGARTEAPRKFSGYRVFLGELLFDFGPYVEGASKCFESYRDEVYAPLSTALREMTEGAFDILPLLTYQDLVALKENKTFYYNLEQDTKDYYRL